MSEEADEHREREDERAECERLPGAHARGSLQQRLDLLAHRLALVRDARLADDDVVEVEVHLSVLEQLTDESGRVVRVELARLARDGGGEVGRSKDGDAVGDDLLVGARELAVAAARSRKVNDDGAAAHRGDHVGGDENRRLAVGDLCGRDDDVRVLHVLGEDLVLPGLGVGFQLACVAAGVLLRLRLDAGLDESRAQRLDLVAHRRPDIKCLDNCAEAAAGGDRLKTGDTRAKDERSRRCQRSRGGHHQREDARQPVGGHHGGVIARQASPSTTGRPCPGRD